MLEIRPNCENCGKPLPNHSNEAMICSFECTFCAECVQNILHNVCPNCGGGFQLRPTRPQAKILKYPPQSQPFVKPINWHDFAQLLEQYKNIAAEDR
jgi:hypothetical protein